MANILQLLRNSTVSSNRETSKTVLIEKLKTLKSGEPAVNFYNADEGLVKALFGISYGDGTNYTIIDVDAVPSDVQDAINALKGGTDEQIADAYDTIKKIADALTVINGNDSTEGSIAKAEKDAKDYTDQQFDEIDPVVAIEQVLKESTNYREDEADKYKFTKHTGATDEVQLTFTPISPLALTVPETIGDIAQGTKCEELNGESLSKLLDSIIFKTIYPTVINPSASVSFASGFTNNATMEAGLAAPTDENMAHTLNKGTVKVADGTTPDQEYVGDEASCTYQMSYTPGAANGNAGVEAGGNAATNVALDGRKMTVGTYKFKAVVNYGEGPVMKTSKGTTPNPMPLANGGTVANPHAAGSVTSGELTLNVTLPVFIDNAANGTFNKQPLKTWGVMTFTGVAMAGQTAAAPTQIKTPRKLQSANSYNAVSGKYDVAQLSNYTMEETTETINGVGVKYYLYKWNGGALSAVNFEIKTY